MGAIKKKQVMTANRAAAYIILLVFLIMLASAGMDYLIHHAKEKSADLEDSYVCFRQGNKVLVEPGYESNCTFFNIGLELEFAETKSYIDTYNIKGSSRSDIDIYNIRGAGP